MRTVKLFLLAMVLLAAIPSCKKCYTCTIVAVPPVCTCENGTYDQQTYTGTIAQAEAGFPQCVANGGTWYQTTTGTSASSNKYCYATGGPLGGALNGASTKESTEEDNCDNQNGTWLPD